MSLKSPRQEITELLLSPEIAENPLNFVMANYPWGVAGSPLEHYDGPRKWQRDELLFLRDHVAENRQRIALGRPPMVYKRAIASGRGIGKSTMYAWLSDWNLSCHLGSTTIISANSEDQLTKITWGEIGKWRQMAMNADFFETTATAVLPAKWYAALLKKQLGLGVQYYYVQAKLWTEERPDAYAGAHNPLGMMLLFDEASGIPKPIWDVAEGYFTEPVLHRYHFAFSNPRRGSGAFFECFHKNRDYWATRSIDSRTVEGTDKEVYRKLIEQHGADSDQARVEVMGQFPRQGDHQFISREAVTEAMARPVEVDLGAPLYMGVDIARYGEDASVVRFRRGRDGRTIPPAVYKGLDNMQLTYRLATLIDTHKPDAVCIDAGGGSGVIDRLRELDYVVHEIPFGGASDDPAYANKRTYMWARVRDDLPNISLDDNPTLLADLTGPEYKFHRSSDAVILESKDDMKHRGLHSPDHGDAWALTYAVKVPRKDMVASRALRGRGVKVNMGHANLRRR
jgi:hypothetical protein